MKHRHVEFAGAARDRLTRAHELQPFVFANGLAAAPDNAAGVRNSGRNFVERLPKRALIDVAAPAEAPKRLALALELLEELIAQVRASGGVGEVEKRRERSMVRFVASFSLACSISRT